MSERWIIVRDVEPGNCRIVREEDLRAIGGDLPDNEETKVQEIVDAHNATLNEDIKCL